MLQRPHPRNHIVLVCAPNAVDGGLTLDKPATAQSGERGRTGLRPVSANDTDDTGTR
jgi:hypothetical protein